MTEAAMNVEIIKCGACFGCEAEAALAKAVADLDALLIPRMADAERQFAAARRDERGVEGRHAWRTRAAHRQIRELAECRGRWIEYLVRAFRWPGCFRFTIARRP